MVFETKLTNFFIWWKCHVQFVRCSIFYILNYSINFESYNVMMCIGTRRRAHFWIFLLNLTHLDMKLEQLIDIAMSNTFRKSFPWFRVLDLTSKLTFVKSCTNIWQNFISILPRIVKNQSKVYLKTCTLNLWWRQIFRSLRIHQKHKNLIILRNFFFEYKYDFGAVGFNLV